MHRESPPVSPRYRAGWGAASLLAAAALSACGSGGGGDSAPAKPVAAGMLRLALTDAPACGFDHVFVTLEKIRLHQSSTALDTDPGWTDVPVTPARRIDLLTLTNGALQELGTTPLPSGHYAQLRLVVGSDAAAPSVQPAGGQELPLSVASSGLRIPVAFDIAAGQTSDLVLDVDACKSVVPAGSAGAYQLKAVGAVFPRSGTAIQGALAASLPPSSTTVSAQQGGTTVRATRPDSAGNFSIPYLQPGTYTLVIHSEGRATGVVAGVPVDKGTTAVSTPSSAIALPESPMAVITGAASASTASDTGATQDSMVTDGEVRASQSLSGGDSIEIRSAPLDALLGTYRLAVPKAAPVKATYSSSGSLSFTADPLDAGTYDVDLVLRDDDGSAD